MCIDIQMHMGPEKEEAIHIYMTAVKIVEDEVRNKLKHPFLSQD